MTSNVSQNNVRAADMFLTRALEKMLGDKEMKRSQHAQLKKACESTLSEIKAASKQPQPHYVPVNDVEKYFLPFELACKSKSSPKLTETALDCIQKLIAHGYLNNNSGDSSFNVARQQLTQRITRTICQCFEGPDVDDSVQLQIIKCLLTILTSPHIEVHEQTLLLPIKTCYNICISSLNLINQASARAALTQIINTIMYRLDQSVEQRLAAQQQQQQQQQQRKQSITTPTTTTTTTIFHHKSKDVDSVSLSSSQNNDTILNSSFEHYKLAYMDVVRNFELSQQPHAAVDTIEENASQIAELMCTMLDAICDLPEDGDGDSDTKSLTSMHQQQQQQQQQQQPHLVNGHHHDTTAATTEDERKHSVSLERAVSRDPELSGIDDPYELDAFLMFRAFCKLSLRSVQSDTKASSSSSSTPADLAKSTNIDVKSKILSLQLILATLQNAKRPFKQSAHVIRAISCYLCVSLSKNGGSTITEVFELTLAIFVCLLADYKQHLKKQIEVFLRDIVIYLLETPTSSFEQKWLIIQTLSHVCANAQLVVDFYINYDCDLHASNIFARLVNILAKYSQGRRDVSVGCTPNQMRSMRLKGLECIVSILKCMVEWSKDLFVNPNVLQSNLGPENRPQDVVESAGQELSKSHASSQNSLAQPQPQHDSCAAATLTYNPSDFETIKSKKELWERGIELFNKKPRKGIQLLQDKELLGTSAEDVAHFLLHDERLDKTAIGDFLGENEKYNKEIMYSYVDQMDFTGMEIVSALRKFLEGFRLPGEAQKIDRLMEKFAARYHELNKKFANPAATANSDEKNVAASVVDKSSGKRVLTNYFFESADSVYVVAFSIIMLATDLHSSAIKKEKKMTKDGYINMNRGINDNKDLPRDFLEAIYDQVAESELKVKETPGTGTPSAQRQQPDSEKKRRLLYNMEIEHVTQTARSLMESVRHLSSSFTSARQGEHIAPMFKLGWTSSLAAFSIGLQDSDDARVIELCLTGVRCAIRIACTFRMELERDAYVQALARFTLLTETTSTISAEMKSKNVECIKTLITVAYTDGNYLGKSWHEILKCISQLDLAQPALTATTPAAAVGATGAGDSMAMSSGGSGGISTKPSIMSSPLLVATAAAAAAAANAPIKESTLLNSTQQQQLLDSSSSSASTMMAMSTSSSTSSTSGETSVSQSVAVAVDRIFTSSIRLDGDAIVEFVKCLCSVSLDELSATPPRMFSLQKIVEISYYNMGRIRLQWTKIWHVLGEHFNKAGCNPNEEVALFVIDSLRQLSMKFLEKGEFAHFRFQKDFLKPFEHIMKRNNSYTIRDMVVQCISQMVKSHAQNIRSGWKNIFGVFHSAASQNDERIVSLAFETMSEIIRNYAEKYFLSILDSFQDAIKCLSEFACSSTSPDISIEAIGLIRYCAIFVAEKPDMFIEYGGTSEEINYNVPEGDRAWMRGWFPILFELSCIINRCKLDVRTRGLTVMFEIMKTYGESFKVHWWKELFNVVFRIFDNMKLPEAQIEKAEWMTTTCNHALYAIVDVFTQYYDVMSHMLIGDLYTHLKWCVNQDNEQLARSGTNCFENFVISNGVKFSEDIWKQTCACLSDLFKSTIPYNLLTWKPEHELEHFSFESGNADASFTENLQSQQQQLSSLTSPKQSNRTNSINSVHNVDDRHSKIPRSKVPAEMEYKTFQVMLIKCVVQLELIETIDNIVFYPTTSKKEYANYIAAAQALSSPTAVAPSNNMFLNEQLFHDDYGMYVHLNNQQLFLLLDCLEESYEFARKFNCNSEQRNILWKAGFKGKEKPNLLKHETQSLACMLRILFKMLNDESRRDFYPNIQTRLLNVTQGALNYYTKLPSESHRESWDNIMLLLLTKLFKLEITKFKTFSSSLYRQLCDIMTFNLKPELRNILREIFIQIGVVHSIQLGS